MNNLRIDDIAALDSPVHRIDARAKIVGFCAIILVSVSTSPQAFAAFGGYLTVVLATLVFARVPLGYVLKRSLVVAPFALMVAMFMPFVSHGNADSSLVVWHGIRISREGLMALWNVAIKAYVGVVSLVTLSATTPFPKLLQGLEQLHTPKLVTLLVSFLYRYLFVLLDEALRMKRAAVSRGYRGRWLWHSGTIGHLVGTLFLRSYERGERVYLAMAARGFTGKPLGFGAARLRLPDYAFLTAALTSALLLRLLACH